MVLNITFHNMEEQIENCFIETSPIIFKSQRYPSAKYSMSDFFNHFYNSSGKPYFINIQSIDNNEQTLIKFKKEYNECKRSNVLFGFNYVIVKHTMYCLNFFWNYQNFEDIVNNELNIANVIVTGRYVTLNTHNVLQFVKEVKNNGDQVNYYSIIDYYNSSKKNNKDVSSDYTDLIKKYNSLVEKFDELETKHSNLTQINKVLTTKMQEINNVSSYGQVITKTSIPAEEDTINKKRFAEQLEEKHVKIKFIDQSIQS